MHFSLQKLSFLAVCNSPDADVACWHDLLTWHAAGVLLRQAGTPLAALWLTLPYSTAMVETIIKCKQHKHEEGRLTVWKAVSLSPYWVSGFWSEWATLEVEKQVRSAPGMLYQTLSDIIFVYVYRRGSCEFQEMIEKRSGGRCNVRFYRHE